MRMWWLGIVAGGMLSWCCVAQESPSFSAVSFQTQGQQTPASSPAQSQQSTGAPGIAAGSVIAVQLTKTIDAKKAKTGDEVDAKVTQDLKTASGEVVMAKDTKVVGHITEAQARTKEQKESQVGIAFDRAVMKDGSMANLPMSVQAVIAPPSQTSRNDNTGGEGVGPTATAPGAETPRRGGGGRSGEMGSGVTPRTSPSPTAGGGQPGSTSQSDVRPTITAKTQGVVGIANYSLSTAGDANQGSVVSSEKSNVKLESGTLLLLRVNQ